MARSEDAVFIIDDDISIRESLQALIASAGWRVVVFATADEFLDAERTPQPGCLVLDVSLPGLNGLELQERLNHTETGLPIIFISGLGDVPTTVRAMKGGAVEFLTKPIETEALLHAIDDAITQSRNAFNGQINLKSLRENFAALSKREREVMQLVTTGLLNKQVGGRLGISEITVKAHRGQVMRKMHAHSFAELVNMAGRLGLTDAPGQ